jgi:hypothetical protein
MELVSITILRAARGGVPAGATCSSTKRRQIVNLADRYGFLILEDAPYRLLRYRGKEEPTLYELAPDRTLHMSSFTKLIAPGVRTGFMIGEPKLIASLAKTAEDTYISPGYVAQGIVYEWCRRGLLPPQIERLKQLYGPRLDACLTGLATYMPDAVPTRPDGGGVSLTLPRRARERGANGGGDQRTEPRGRPRVLSGRRRRRFLRCHSARSRRRRSTTGSSSRRERCRQCRPPVDQALDLVRSNTRRPWRAGPHGFRVR